MPWDVHQLPRAEGRTFLITGGNTGIGYFIAEQLAGTGAGVVIGSRTPAKAQAAITAIHTRVPDARIRAVELDLADLSSVKSSVDRLELDRVDAVVHNAGVLSNQSQRAETVDGHELTFGTNHLGHFALTAHLMPLMAPDGRVVVMGSIMGKSAQLDLDDLQSIRDYQTRQAYSRSKLAQMLFGFELDRRLRAADSSMMSVVVHPGGAFDSLTPSRPPVHVRTTGQLLRGLPARILVQGKDAAAWPAVRAVLDPAVRGGQLWGPRVFGMRGKPRLEPVKGPLADTATAARLWAISAELTGVAPPPFERP